jgi:peptidyl-prolyl cis-trans isomerase C
MTTRIRLFAGLAAALAITSPAMAQDSATGKAAEPAATAEKTAPKVDATADTVVATVNGTEITVGDMISLRGQLPQQYRQLPDEVLFDGILEQLIQQTALVQNLGDDLSRTDKLALETNRRSYLAGAALSRAAESAVTDEAIKALYESTYGDFVPATEYNAAHIIVETEEEAKTIKAAIDGGADFAEQAKEHSTDGAAQSGGDLGWFGEGAMVPEFETAIKAMKKGEVAGPVQTQFGWHLIKLNDTRQTTAPTLEEAREELVGTLQRQAAEALIGKVTDAASITRSTEGVDRSVLSNQNLLQN